MEHNRLMLALVDLLLPFRSRFYYNSKRILFPWLDRCLLWTVAKWNDQFCDRNSHNYIYLSFILFPMETRSQRPYRIFLALPWHPTAFINIFALYPIGPEPHAIPSNSLISSGPLCSAPCHAIHRFQKQYRSIPNRPRNLVLHPYPPGRAPSELFSFRAHPCGWNRSPAG